MRVDLSPFNELTEADCATWRALRASDPSFASPFFGPEFAQAVAAVRKDVRVLRVELDGRTVIVWPIQGSRGAMARPVGAPLNDRHGPLLDPDWRASERGSSGLARVLARAVGQVRLNGVQFASAVTGVSALDPWASASEVNRSVQLTADLAAYWADRTKCFAGHFKDMRRRRRAAERDGGPLTLDHGPEATREALRLVRLWKHQQFLRTAKHNVLAPEWVVALMDRLAALHDDQRTDGLRGDGVILRIGGVPAAVEFNLREGAVLHSWMTAYDPAFRAYSPGMILIEDGLTHFAREGIREVDLGISHDHYKKYYATDELTLLEGVVRADTPFGKLGGALAGGWQGLEASKSAPKVGALAKRLRRRLDLILAVEPGLTGRLKGVWHAAFPPGPSHARQTR